MRGSERLNRAEAHEREQLESFVSEVRHYAERKGSQKMTVDRAITEAFRERNMSAYPKKTLDSLRDKIKAEIERQEGAATGK